MLEDGRWCMCDVRSCSSRTSRRISSGKAARKSSDISGCSSAGDGCLDGDVDGSSILLEEAVAGRIDIKSVSVMLPDVFVRGRPRRLLVGVAGLVGFKGPEYEGRETASEGTGGWL